AAIAALAGPASATAGSIPLKQLAPRVAKRVTRPRVVPRVLCICVTIPASELPVASEVELEADVDLELLAHGLEPAYASYQTTPELQAQYDAVLIAHGLGPYFGTGGGGVPGD
ncbi:MAG TPA: hypothetical protein VH951_05890, partial [Dehalococcoidia bacterium]